LKKLELIQFQIQKSINKKNPITTFWEIADQNILLQKNKMPHVILCHSDKKRQEVSP
jgi:hypothetical protein